MKNINEGASREFPFVQNVVLQGKDPELKKNPAHILNKASKSVCWVFWAGLRLCFRYGEGVGGSVGTGRGCPMPGTAFPASAGPGSYIRGASMKNRS